MSKAACGLGVIGMRRNLPRLCGIASAGEHWLDPGVPIFRNLQCWIDPDARDGPHAMAVDEWLCGVVEAPVLRVYRWDGDWCSAGYFGNLTEAKSRIDCPNWVRRITGGGVVDHRGDWTYSLVIPKSEPAANWRGDASYRAIHDALAAVLRADGVDCRLSSGAAVAGEALCFANPVDHDIVGPDGEKLAGAGQRRSREGLLHQGSLALPLGVVASENRAHALAMALAKHVECADFFPVAEVVAGLVRERYGSHAWLDRR